MLNEKSYGFPVVWEMPEELKTSSDFNIVAVPKEAMFAIRYSKPSLGLDLTIKPEESSAILWRVGGTADADIISNLALPVYAKRQGYLAPVVGQSFEQIAKNFGSIEKNADDEKLWDLDLKVPVNSKYKFLDRSWRPRGVDLSMWHLTKVGEKYRYIPQKRTKEVSMQVVNMFEEFPKIS